MQGDSGDAETPRSGSGLPSDPRYVNFGKPIKSAQA